MSERAPAPQAPLAEMVRWQVRQVLHRLGSHRDPALYRRIMTEVERVLIEEALAQSGGVRGEAAAILGIHRNTLRQRMQQLGILGA